MIQRVEFSENRHDRPPKHLLDPLAAPVIKAIEPSAKFHLGKAMRDRPDGMDCFQKGDGRRAVRVHLALDQ
jgi:hypothetical protein